LLTDRMTAEVGTTLATPAASHAADVLAHTLLYPGRMTR
jgi:hypothetical protein